MSKKNTETKLTIAQLKSSALSPSVNSAMFTDAANFALPEGAVVTSQSPMMKPADFPENRVLTGVFKRIFTTNPTADKKGCGVEIVPEGAQIGIALPAVATIARGLAISNADQGDAATSPYIGRKVAIQKLPEKIKSKKGQDGWNFVIAILP